MVEEPSSFIAYRFRRVLIPIVPQHHAEQAISIAAELATNYGSRLTFLYVASSENDPAIQKVREMLESRLRGVDYELKIRVMNPGETPASEIVKELSETHYDLVIMSTRGYYGVAALVYESTSIAVALAANTSVLILR
ncbi:MAG: universal stress protein [Crenarchaeota archaeon]|nr:universal stress protein [Thermoproteota archaeon]